MSSLDNGLASTEAGLPQAYGSGTKRQHDDLDEADETESSPTHKKQRVVDNTFEDIWNFDNLDDPAFFLGPCNLNIPELNNGQFVVGSDGMEIPYTLDLQPHNYPDPDDVNTNTNSIYDAAADNLVLAPEPAIDLPEQLQSLNTGGGEGYDWPPPNWDGVLHHPIWDYIVDPMLEAQSFGPDTVFVDENGVPCFTDSSPVPPQETAAAPEDAKVQAEQTGEIGALDEAQFNPDLYLSSYLASYTNSSDGQKTKASSLTSSDSAPFDVEEDQNPLFGQMSFQEMFYDASFQPETWAVQAEFHSVETGNLPVNGAANNYPLQYLEPSACHDGDQTQVEE
ncbi:hypothetical protein B0T20DRAFT_338853, partial [Sordaria brevicollis]